MATASISLDRPRFDPTRILATGTLVALLDGAFVVLVYVAIVHRTTALRIFQGIASALLGPAAFDGGLGTGALGLGMHLCVALGWTVVYVALFSRIPAVQRAVRTTGGMLIVGIVYGMFVWLMMNNAIVPLTHAKTAAFNNWVFWLQLAWHPFGVGLPIVAMNRNR